VQAAPVLRVDGKEEAQVLQSGRSVREAERLQLAQ